MSVEMETNPGVALGDGIGVDQWGRKRTETKLPNLDFCHQIPEPSLSVALL
jgi:hypothetical protein